MSSFVKLLNYFSLRCGNAEKLCLDAKILLLNNGYAARCAATSRSVQDKN